MSVLHHQGCLRRGLARTLLILGCEASRAVCLKPHTAAEKAVSVIDLSEDFVCVILTSSSVEAL